MIEQFFTRDKANEGIEVPLSYPNGEVSEYSLRIRGVDSDHFRQAERKSVRRAVELRQEFKENEEKAQEAFDEERLWLVSQLVIGWNFPEEFTEENLLNFLRNAPNVADRINEKAADRKTFFKKESDSSKNTPDGSTGSKSRRKGQSKA